MNSSTTTNTTVPPSSRGAYRLEITCPVQFLGPLHVGMGERLSVVSDAPVLRDVDGKPYLPESSVRGVLRDFCEREAQVLGLGWDCVQRLFGETPDAEAAARAERNRLRGQDKDPKRLGDRQGRLTVFDVELTPRTAAESQDGSEVRDHVKIHRKWAAAAHGGKFDQEIVHCAAATIRLVYEGDGPGDPEVRLLRRAVWALERGLLAFGGKTGWGLGWVRGKAKLAHGGQKQYETEYREFRRSNPNDLTEYLLARLKGQEVGGKQAGSNESDKAGESPPSSQAAGGAKDKEAGKPWNYLWLDLELQFDGPMLVAGPDRDPPASERERSPDAAFLKNIDESIVLPGSSFRGVIHSHCDRIATTLDCKERVAEVLFGIVKGEAEQAKDKDKGKQGLLRVGDGRLCVCKDGPCWERPPSEEDARQATSGTKAQPGLCKSFNAVTHTVWMDHVAIDRITGFAADQRLFNTRALASPRFFTPILVRWHDEDRQMKAAVALLLFALRDAEAGLLWVGSRTTRGYGHLKTVHVHNAWLSTVKQRSSGQAAAGEGGLVQEVKVERIANLGAEVADLIDAWKSEARIDTPTAGSQGEARP